MAQDKESLQKKIEDLQDLLIQKDRENAHYRLQLQILNGKLEEMIEQVGQDLRLVQKIHRILVPTEIPTISGFEFSSKYRSGSRYGGDYFDIFEHQDHMKFGVLLASSANYSTSAMFLSLLIRMSTKMEARKGYAPHEWLQTLAKEMVPELKDAQSIHLFYGVVDKRTYELEYVSVGQQSHVLMGADDNVQVLRSQGPAISPNFNTQLQSQKLILKAKDRLVLSSRGVLEAINNKDKQPWGEDRLVECLRTAPKTGLHDLRHEILYSVESYSGLLEPLRDQTVVLVEVKDRIIKLAPQ